MNYTNNITFYSSVYLVKVCIDRCPIYSYSAFPYNFTDVMKVTQTLFPVTHAYKITQLQTPSTHGYYYELNYDLISLYAEVKYYYLFTILCL